MSTSNEQAKTEDTELVEKVKRRKEYAEFEDKVKRTVFIDNLSPQVTSSVLQTAIEQFATVRTVEFLTDSTIPYPIPKCALVEVESAKQAVGVINTITNYPFMVSGMPRPVRAQAATIEMFADRPSPPERKIQVRWVEPSDPNFNVAKKMKQLCKKHTAETLALTKLIQDEEEKLSKHQEEALKANYKKYEMIDGVLQDGSKLARAYGFQLETDD